MERERRNVMKTLARTALVTGLFLIGIAAPAAAQSSEGGSNPWYNRWHKAKFGHISQQERAAQAGTAYRSEPAGQAVSAERSWYDRWSQAKFRQDSPKEAARKKADRDSTAFRAEPRADGASPARKQFERWHKAKFGHSPRQAAQR
jgi:hypothetical protein